MLSSAHSVTTALPDTANPHPVDSKFSGDDPTPMAAVDATTAEDPGLVRHRSSMDEGAMRRGRTVKISDGLTRESSNGALKRHSSYVSMPGQVPDHGTVDPHVSSFLSGSHHLKRSDGERANDAPSAPALGMGGAADHDVNSLSDWETSSNASSNGTDHSEVTDIDTDVAAVESGVYKLKPTCWNAVDRRVPFSAQVSMLMSVPLVFLIVYSALNFAAANDHISFLSQHQRTLQLVAQCSAAAIAERQSTCYYLRNATAHVDVEAARNATDTACLALVAEMRRLTWDLLRGPYADQVVKALSSVAVLRYQVDSGASNGRSARAKFASFITTLFTSRLYFAGVAVLAPDARDILSVKLAWEAINQANLATLVGLEVLSGRAVAIDALDVKEIATYQSNFQQTAQELLHLAGTLGQQFYADFVGSVASVKAQQLLQTLVDDPSGVGASSAITVPVWQSDMAILSTTASVLVYQKAQLQAYIASSSYTLGIEGTKLGLALLASVAAGWLIVQSQLRAQRKMAVMVANSRSMQRAVLKFVPKQFLRLSGCTSILQVVPGDFTEVALSMLFSDIRSFTTIAERMSNAELFRWLQQQFERMTRVTEQHHGFVDKFVGDAIFSVFSEPRNAIDCGVAMQTTVTQLNAEIVGRNETQVVAIGVGIHHAVSCLGFLGDATRITCTLISADVNLASRLEGLTKFYGAGIIVSDKAWERLGTHSYAHRKLGAVTAKGSAKAVGILEVFQSDPLPLKQHKERTLASFSRAVALQEGGQLEAARACFLDCEREAAQAGVHDVAAQLKGTTLDGPLDRFDEK